MECDVIACFHHAIIEQDDSKTAQLLERDIDVNAIYDRETALTRAIQQNPINFNIVTSIIESPNFDVNAGNQWSRTPLFISSINGNIGIMKCLIAIGADINKCDNRTVTPLGSTGYYNKFEAAKILIESGADINALNTDGETTLYRACRNKAIDVVNLLLEHSCDVDIKTTSGSSALIETVRTRILEGDEKLLMIEMMKKLLEHGCDVDIKNKFGETALHVATEQNQIHVAFILLHHGADVYLKNNEGSTCLHVMLSESKQYFQMAILFILFGIDLKQIFSDDRFTPVRLLLQCAKTPKTTKHERQFLLRLVLTEMEYNSNDLGKCLEGFSDEDIHLASDVKIVKECILKHPSLQGICKNKIRRLLGQNVISKISTLSIGNPLKTLLSYGLDCSCGNLLNVSELQLAAEVGNLQKMKDLVEAGVDVNLQLFGNSPLGFATYPGSVSSVEFLLEHGANPTIKSLDGDTPLHIAARRGHLNIVATFLSKGCDVNMTNDVGNLPIHEASSQGKFEVVRLLTQNDSKVDIPDCTGIYPIHYAAASGDLELVRILIQRKASVSAVDRQGNSPLHLAVSTGVVYLEQNISLPAKYSSNLVMEMKMTSLIYRDFKKVSHTAEDTVQYMQIVAELISSGCDTNLRNNNGKKAGDIASEYGFDEFLSML